MTQRCSTLRRVTVRHSYSWKRSHTKVVYLVEGTPLRHIRNNTESGVTIAAILARIDGTDRTRHTRQGRRTCVAEATAVRLFFFYTNAQTQLTTGAARIWHERVRLLHAAMTASSCMLKPFVLANAKTPGTEPTGTLTLYLCHDLGLKSQAWCCWVVVCWCENCGVNKENAGRAAQRNGGRGDWTEVTSSGRSAGRRQGVDGSEVSQADGRCDQSSFHIYAYWGRSSEAVFQPYCEP